MDRPLVSVCIVTYNHESFIRQTIDSVLSQTYKNYEIIVGDDFSTDGTREILLQYKAQLGDKVKLIFQEKNLGITKNHNSVLEQCKGKYIVWLGGDDLYLPNKLETQVEFMENNKDIVLSYHNVEVFESSTNRLLYYINEVNPKLVGGAELFIKYGVFCGGCSVMYVREKSAKCFDERIPISSDWLYWIQTSYNGKIGYVDEVLSRYRKHSRNITKLTKIETVLEEQIATLRIVEEDNIISKDIVAFGLARIYYVNAINFLLNDNKKYEELIQKSVESSHISIKQKLFYWLSKLKLGRVFKSMLLVKNPGLINKYKVEN